MKIDILGAERHELAVESGCTTRLAQLPTPFAERGLHSVRFDSLAPQAELTVATPAGALRLVLVLDGMLSYRDSLGREDRALGGEVLLLEAAEPVTQTLENRSESDTVDLVSLYADGALVNRCVQRYFSDDARRNRLCPVLSADGVGDSLPLDSGLAISVASLAAGGAVVVPTPAVHYAMVCAMSNPVLLEGRPLEQGALALVSTEVPALRITSEHPAEVLAVLAAPTRV